ncbi:MAG: biotin synthase BioB [Actinomycetia bacterium]|nr:biotin synthase BioB [Actinomycetes bacterium]
MTDTGAAASTLLARCEERGRAGEPLDRDDALAVLGLSDADTIAAVTSAGRLRREAFGNLVKLNFLVNVKSGLCPEDCNYCSQRRGSEAGILTYDNVGADVVADAAERAVHAGAARVCLVSSGRGPSERDLEHISESVMAVHDAHPDLEVCACLGLLTEGQAERLVESGVYAYNHNLNTSESHYDDICSTHTFDDRIDTVERARDAGLSPCSGALFGMGETDDDIVEVAFALRALEPDSVPINFLIPIDGTPLAGKWELTPQRCLRILALYRYMFPDTEIRIAGGREVHLRSVQGLGLELANSIFVGDYLTTEGQAANADLDLLADWGFEPLELPDSPPATREQPTHSPASSGDDEDLVRIRRRGVGTSSPPNA